jgi:hypothetical protein
MLLIGKGYAKEGTGAAVPMDSGVTSIGSANNFAKVANGSDVLRIGKRDAL